MEMIVRGEKWIVMMHIDRGDENLR